METCWQCAEMILFHLAHISLPTTFNPLSMAQLHSFRIGLSYTCGEEHEIQQMTVEADVLFLTICCLRCNSEREVTVRPDTRDWGRARGRGKKGGVPTYRKCHRGQYNAVIKCPCYRFITINLLDSTAIPIFPKEAQDVQHLWFKIEIENARLMGLNILKTLSCSSDLPGNIQQAGEQINLEHRAGYLLQNLELVVLE